MLIPPGYVPAETDELPSVNIQECCRHLHIEDPAVFAAVPCFKDFTAILNDPPNTGHGFFRSFFGIDYPETVCRCPVLF
jgi:hypothetical protein